MMVGVSPKGCERLSRCSNSIRSSVGYVYYFAHDYALLGDKGQALLWLQKALKARQSEILNLAERSRIRQLKD